MTKEEVIHIIRTIPENAAIVDTSLLDNDTIREYADYVDWFMLSEVKNLGMNFAREMIDRLYLPQVWKNKHFTEEQVEELLSYLTKNKEPYIKII